jgi:hypothetical protein
MDEATDAQTGNRDAARFSSSHRVPSATRSASNSRLPAAIGPHQRPPKSQAGIVRLRSNCESQGGGGGNCTRVPISTSICPACGHDVTPCGWPEHGREDEAFRELVANWHRLTPSVRAAILVVVRGGRDLARRLTVTYRGTLLSRPSGRERAMRLSCAFTGHG